MKNYWWFLRELALRKCGSGVIEVVLQTPDEELFCRMQTPDLFCFSDP